MYNDSDFKLCKFICNKGKHLALDQGDRDTKSVRSSGAAFGATSFGSVGFGEGPSLKFYVDEREINFVDLGEKLIANWERFFADNGI